MKPKNRVMTLPVYEPGKPIEEVKREYGLNEIIKLASNENPFGASPNVQEAIIQEAANVAIYPDGASTELREALAAYYNLPDDWFIFGAGTNEVCVQITRAFLEAGTNTVMPVPTFPRYVASAIMDGAHTIEVPLTDGEHDLEKMLAHIDANTRVIWLCSPNNPTGKYLTNDELTQFMSVVPNDVLVVLDEAYVEYVTADDYADSFQVLDEHENVIILRTFSKAYGLASLRIGYGIARPEIIDVLNRVREPFNTTRIAQKAAIAALEDQSFIEQCRHKNREGLQQYYTAFDEWGLTYFPSQGNFIFVNVEQPGNRVFEQLLQEGIIVRSGEAMGYSTWLRITVGSKEQNELVLRALQAHVKRV